MLYRFTFCSTVILTLFLSVINGNEQEENSSVIVKINPLIGKSKKIIQFRGNGRHKRGNNGPEKYSIFLEFPESFFSNSKLRSLYSSLIGEDGAVAKNETDKTATKLVFKLDPPKFGSDAATEISAKKKGMNVSTTAAGLKEVSKLEEELKKSATLRAFATTGTSKQGSRIGRSIDDSSNKMFFEPNCPPSSPPCTKPPSFPSSCPASCPKPCPSPKPCPCPKPCPTPKPCPCPKPCPPKPCDCPKPCPCPLTCPCPASCCKPPPPCCPSDDVQLSGKKASPTYEVTNKNNKDKIADESATMRALRHMMRSDPRGNHNTFDSHSNSGKGDIQMDDTGHVPLKGHKGCPLVPSYLCPPCCIYPQIRPCPFSCCPTLGPLVCTSPARCPNESKFCSDVEHQVISKQRRIEEHPKRIYQHFLWKPYSRLRRNLLSMKRNGNGSRDLNTTNMVVDQKQIFANRSCVKLPTVCWGCPCSTTCCPTRPPCGSSRPPCCSSAPQAASPNPEFAARELSPDVQSALPLIVQAPVEEPLRNIPQFIWRKLDSNLLSHLLMNTSISNTVLNSTDLDTIPVFDDPPLSNYSEKNISQDNETVLANKCGPCCCMPPCPKVVSAPIPPCCRPLPTPPPPCCPPPSPPCCPGSKLVNSEKHNSNWRKLNSRLRKDLSRSISVGDLVLNGTSHSRRHIRLNTNKHQDSRGKNRPAASVPTI